MAREPPRGDVITGDRLSYDVRVWNIRRYLGKRRTSYVLRWQVAGKKTQRTFATLKLAEAFRAEIMVAAREGTPFSIDSGLPRSMQVKVPARTWLDHSMQYVTVKWPAVSARHRRGIAEALTDITLAVLPDAERHFDDDLLRRALYGWAFNVTARMSSPPDDLAAALRWLERTSPTLDEVAGAERLRRALDRLAVRLDGSAAAPATLARKRATLHAVLEYGVELELFASNPLTRMRWRAPRGTDAVDRWVVVNPEQARALLEAVWERDTALAAFFACLYYAGLRPGEARALRVDECMLPESGWGQLLLTGSHQTSGSAWTDSSRPGEDRALKHRAAVTPGWSPPIRNSLRRFAAICSTSRLERTGASS